VQVLLDSKVTGPSSRMVLERGSTLYSLIRWNDAGMAQLLLGSATSSARSSALYEAAKRKDTAVVKTLLDAGVGDTPYQFALQVAAEQAAPELVRLLLDAAPSVQPAQPGTVGDGSNLQPFAVGMGYALLWAISAGRAESVRLLLQAGAPTGPMLPEGGGNDVPQHVACIPGQRHWTQAALGLKTPEGCKLPLHVAVKQAVRSCDMSLVCLLLAAGQTSMRQTAWLDSSSHCGLYLSCTAHCPCCAGVVGCWG
jgi:ankyrin repeat protein